MNTIKRELYVEGGYSVSNHRGNVHAVAETPLITTELTITELYKLFASKAHKGRQVRQGEGAAV